MGKQYDWVLRKLVALNRIQKIEKIFNLDIKP